MRKQILVLSFVLALLSIPSFMMSQSEDTYQNEVLGIEFRYTKGDFDAYKDKFPQMDKWIVQQIPRLGMQLRLPPDYTTRIAKIDRDWSVPSCPTDPISDSAFIIGIVSQKSGVFTQAAQLYFTSADFSRIAFNQGFVPRDSANQEVMEYDTTAGRFRAVLALNNWGISGRAFTKKAYYLDGKTWKGIRGFNYTGTYNANGYAGLDYFYTSFLYCRANRNCSIVCSYVNQPDARNPLKEYRFYDIVSSIVFIK